MSGERGALGERSDDAHAERVVQERVERTGIPLEPSAAACAVLRHEIEDLLHISLEARHVTRIVRLVYAAERRARLG